MNMEDKTYDIVPFQRVGEISLEDSREQVRNKIGGPIMDGEYKFEDIIELYDYFPESDIKVLYDRYGNLGAVEFYQGNVVFEGKDIFSSSYMEVKDFFEAIDTELDIDMGFKSYKYGVGVCGDKEDNIVTSVIIFKKDYYN